MKSIIIYGSRYGSARRYAQELSKQTGIPDVSYQEAPLLSELETVVYIGALYAGGVLGLTKTLRRQSFGEHQRLVIVTVGQSDRNHDGAAAPISAKETSGRMERRRQGVNGNLRQASRFCRFCIPAADHQ